MVNIPTITVAVSTFRESYLDWLIQLLSSLKSQTYKDFNVFVVVNGNLRYFKRLNERVKDERYWFDVQIVFNPEEHGIAHDRNIALKGANARYIVFTDDDVIPDRNWLRTVNQTFATNGAIGAVTGPVKAKWGSEAQRSKSWFPRELYWAISCTHLDFSCVKEVRNGFASNLALDRAMALRCGGFNEAFGYNRKDRMVGEEPDFSIRLKKMGKFTCWNPKLVVYHRITSNRLRISDILIRSYIEGRTKAYLKGLYGKQVISFEMHHLQKVMHALFKIRSFRSRMYLATSTIVVGIGYVLTLTNIGKPQKAFPKYNLD